MAIALVAGHRQTGTATPGTTVGLTLSGAPTVANLLVASCVAANGSWTAPAGWNTAVAGSGTVLTNTIFWRQVQAGDTAGPYTFTNSVSDTLFAELEEWGGFTAGTISQELSATHDQSSGFSSHSINPGTTVNAVSLVKVVLGLGGSTATTSSWNQSISVDTQFVANRSTTGHVVTSATQSFNPTTASWLVSTNSSTISMASWYVGASGVSQMGTTGVGGLTAGIPIQAKFGNVYTAATTGNITDFQFYAAGNGTDQTFVPVVYAVSGGVPTTLLATGAPVTVAAAAAAGFKTSAMSLAVTSGTSYLLGLVSGDAGSGANIYYAASGTNHRSPLAGASGGTGGTGTSGLRNALGFYPGDGTSAHEMTLYKAGGNGGPYVSQSLLKWVVLMLGNGGDETNVRNNIYGHFLDPTSWRSYGAGVPRIVIQTPLAIGLFNTTAANRAVYLQDTINGVHDGMFDYLATSLVSGGFSNAVIRLGHEFDGNWYPWSSSGGNSAAYAAAFRHAVTRIRGNPGTSGFLFDWCSAANQTYDTAAYPGDAYVDIIGGDQYDQNSAANVANFLGPRRDFAIAHGKAFSVPEWGCSSILGTYGGAGGDNPSYIQAMYDFLVALPASGGGSIMYQSYFLADQGASFGNDALFHFPNAQARFTTLFGP